MGCVGLWVMSPVLFALTSVGGVRFVNKCYRDRIKKIFLTRHTVIIQMLLHIMFIPWRFSTVILMIISSVLKVSKCLSNIINTTVLTCKEKCKTISVTITLVIYFITVLVNVFALVTLRFITFKRPNHSTLLLPQDSYSISWDSQWNHGSWNFTYDFILQFKQWMVYT